MFVALTITSRQALQMLIVLLPLMIYATKIDKEELKKYVLVGSLGGLVINVLYGLFIVNQVEILSSFSKDIFLGGTMLFIILLVQYNIVWVGEISRLVLLNGEKDYEVKIEKISLFLLAFFAVFRESLEIAVSLIIIIPLLLIFTKKQLKNIIIKNK